MKTVTRLLVVVSSLSLAGCGTQTGNGGLPLLTPPVRAAAPAAFGGGSTATQRLAALPTGGFYVMDGALSAADFATRFFKSGPTDIYTILGAIDSRLTDINSQSAKACSTQAPVSYSITPFGQTVAMVAQCYQTVGDKGFLQWGVQSGVTYLYVQIGAGNLAAVVTPGASGAYSVQAWATVGNAGTYNSNGTTPANWDSIGSYGVMQLTADSAKTSLEMVAAGVGLGYCGAHFLSDGTNIYGEGSVDNGATCQANAPLCVQAADGTTPVAGDCSVNASKFALQSIGRKEATSPDAGTLTNPPAGGKWGASLYPATPNITLDGTDSDSLSFGPKTPTAGAGEFK